MVNTRCILRTRQAVGRARQQCCSPHSLASVCEHEPGQAADLWHGRLGWCLRRGEGPSHPLHGIDGALELQSFDEADKAVEQELRRCVSLVTSRTVLFGIPYRIEHGIVVG